MQPGPGMSFKFLKNKMITGALIPQGLLFIKISEAGILQATSLLKTTLKVVSPTSVGDFFCQVNLMTAFFVSTPSALALGVGKSVKTRVIRILSLAFFAHGCKQHNASSFLFILNALHVVAAKIPKLDNCFCLGRS